MEFQSYIVEKMMKSKFLRFKDLDPGFSIMKTGSVIENVCEWMIHCLQSIKKKKNWLGSKTEVHIGFPFSLRGTWS
jgi:hypothetical protein